MDQDRAKFLYGAFVEPDEHNLNDLDVRSRLLQDSFDEEVELHRLVGYEIVANQIAADDPAETWLAAQRMLAAGYDRHKIFGQLVMAFGTVARDVSAEHPLDKATLADAMNRLPLPPAADLRDAYIELARSSQGISADDLDAAVLARFGADDAPPVDELLNRIIEDLVEDDGPLAWLSGDRTVHVGDLTEGIVLTHRLNSSEIALNTIVAAFDLAGFTRIEQFALASGGTVRQWSGEPGHLAWKMPEGWFDNHSPGELLSCRVSDGDQLTIDILDTEPALDLTLVARLRAVYDTEHDQPGLPVRAEDLVLGLQLDDRSTFAQPHQPLSELAQEAKLETRMDSAAHNDAVWLQATQLQRLHRMMATLDHDQTLAAMRIADLADIVAQVPGADEILDDEPMSIRDALDSLHDAEVFSAISTELYDGPEAKVEGRTPAFVDALVDGARKAHHIASARFLAALGAEREGNLPQAEEHLLIGHRAAPDSAPVNDRLAWYASDRGDAARALSLWRAAERSPVMTADLAAIETAARLTASPVGRNDPCWCGSGRKYKQCHLGTTSLPPLPERLSWMCRKAVSYMERVGGEAKVDLYDIAEALADYGDQRAIAAVFGDPLVMDLALHECGWFGRFLNDRAPLLPDDEYILMSTWGLVERTVYEITGCVPGHHIDVRDVRTGEKLTVSERTFSRNARPGMFVCARAVPDGAGHQFIGGLFAIAETAAETVLYLCDDGNAYELASYVASTRRASRIQTREGEEMVECTVVLGTTDVAALRHLLDTSYETDTDDTWVEMHELSDVERIHRADLELCGDRLTVSTRSRERADRILGLICSALPDTTILVNRRRPISAEQAMSTRPASVQRAMSGQQDFTADQLNEIRDMMEQRWCDESVPALDGMTPRDAADHPIMRDRLIRLIDSFDTIVPPGVASLANALSQRPERLRELLGL